MKIKFKKALSEKLKDMGLTEKAIDDLVEIGCEGLKDDASDEDINQKVDLLVPYAKVMQGEITRKTRKPNHQTKTTEEVEVEGEQDAKIAAIIAKQLAPLTQSINDLKAENEALKAAKAKGERDAQIAEKAKKLGIPEFLLKDRTFPEDADLDKVLGDFKNDLVSHNLMPKGAAQETGKIEDQMKADADAWAKGLPDNN
jgi:DNA-directed RNA polymerase specialized sigma subunit